MGRTSRRIVAPLLTLAVVLTTAGAASAALTNQERAERGTSFLAFAQKPNGSIPAFSPIGSTADAVLAFVATGVGRRQIRSALAYLRRQVLDGNVTGVGLEGKVVMAVSAAGRDPRDFGDVNLLKAIRSTIGDDGHMDDAPVFDQALGVLAIRSAGVQPSASVVGWLHDAQCPDGGWAYDAPYAPGTDDEHCDDGSGTDFFTSDSNTTSYVVQAMEAAGHGSFDADPFAFFDTVRDGDHGGWAYSTGFIVTDANSSALVIQAYASADEPVPSGGLAALRDLQYRRCGAWAYTWDGDAKGAPDVGATIGAVPGILRAPLPITGRAEGDVPAAKEC
jgi:hypothetical protein